MSTSAKVITGIVVVVAIIVGVQYATQSSTKTPAAPTSNAATSSAATSDTAAAPAPAAVDSSDGSIDQDLTTLDAQIKASATDSANVDQSMNDKPVSQE